MALGLARTGPVGRPPDLVHAGAVTEDMMQAMLRRFYKTPFTVATSGTVPVALQARYFITKAGICAITFDTAPITPDDDNVEIEFVSETAFAHTVTFASGVLKDGAHAAPTTATFAAFAGAAFCIVHRNGHSNVVAANGVTFS